MQISKIIQTYHVLNKILILTLFACTISCKKENHLEIPAKEPRIILNDSDIIETSILWKAEIDPVSWSPIALKALLEDKKRFKKVDNFYEVMDETEAFGGEIVYLNLVGIEAASGPNAIVRSDPSNIANYVTKKYSTIDLKQINEDGETVYLADIGTDLRLLIVRHPTIKGTSIVIGEYTGQ